MLSKSVIITLDLSEEVRNVEFITVNVPDDVLDTPTVITTHTGENKLVKLTFGTKIPDFSKFTIAELKQIAITGVYKNASVVSQPTTAVITPKKPVDDVIKLEDVKPATPTK